VQLWLVGMLDRPSRLTPAVRVAGFVLALLAAAGVLHTQLLAGLGQVGSGPQLPWVLLVAGFVLAERFVVYLRAGTESVSFSVIEVPLVLGLFLATPTQTITASVVGATLVFIFHQRQPLLKLVFNISHTWLQAAAAVAVWRALVGDSDPFSLPGALAALAAGITIELVSAICVGGALALHTGSARAARPVALPTGLLLSGAFSCLGLVVLDVLRANPLGLWTVLVLAGFLVLAQRAHLALLRRHSSLEQLELFTRRIGSGDLHLDAVIGSVLTGVRDLLQVEVVTLELASGDGGPAAIWSCDAEGVHEGPPSHQLPSPASPPSQRRGGRRLLTVALQGEAGRVGSLTVADREGDRAGLRQSDRTLLDAIGGHVALALHNGRLAEQLRTQVVRNEHQATHDALTALPNRLLLERTIDRPSAGSAVLLLDLDRFKEINDTLGHAAGDAVLKEISQRLTALLPEQACLARLGGDEFGAVLAGAGVVQAQCLADAIRGALASPLELGGLTLVVDASIGIAVSPEHGTDAASLLRHADIAMYAAKTSHAGTCVYDPVHDHHSATRLSLVADLRVAIDAGQLVLAYQPKTATSGREVAGVEALVRWQHPVRGLVPPDDFIGIAEQTGLIGPLTDWVTATALAQCRTWLDSGLRLGVAINISPSTLHDTAFPTRIAQQLAQAGVPACQVTLEITEGALMVDPERAVSVLLQLRQLGVRLSVDDLGVGHSSLAYLKRLPVHEIKIDRSFVSGMADDPDDQAIVAALVKLVHQLRMTVVAEGVEDQRTLDALAQIGADSAQGYWMSRPLPAAEIPAWLHRWSARSADATATVEGPRLGPCVLTGGADRPA
jgi:diguanylate cyclase (GGDEF)-like protein